MQIGSSVSVQSQNGFIPSPKSSCSARRVILVALLVLSLLAGAGCLIAGIVLGCLPLGIIGGSLLIVSLSALALKAYYDAKLAPLSKLIKNKNSQEILSLFHKYGKGECPHMLAPLSERAQGKHSTGWAIPKSKVTLISSYGNISEPAFLPTQGQSWMVVNSTNKTGDGKQFGTTGSDLFCTLSPRSWYDRGNQSNLPQLQPGDCIIRKWETLYSLVSLLENRRDTWDSLGTPGYVCHVCGPKAKECKNDLNLAFNQLKVAYTNCFIRALYESCQWIQLPLLAGCSYTSIDAPKQGDPIYQQWKEMAKRAFLVALVEFSEQHPNYPLTVVLIDKFRKNF